MLLIKFLSFLEELFAESEICNLEDIVIDKYILRFDIPMYDVEFIKILKGIEYLFEVLQYLLFFSDLSLTVKDPEVIIQIFVITILKDEIDPVIFSIADHVLDLDDVGVVPQFYKGFHLLSGEGYYFIDLLDLLYVVGDADDLQGKLIDAACLLVLVVADVDAAV